MIEMWKEIEALNIELEKHIYGKVRIPVKHVQKIVVRYE